LPQEEGREKNNKILEIVLNKACIHLASGGGKGKK
jgi:hypothetical protein